MVTIRLKGLKSFTGALDDLTEDIRTEVGKAVVGTALELQGDIKKSVSRGPATGRVYRKQNPTRVHQASAPGQAPQTDTGRLVNSITFDRVGQFTATVGSKLVYAMYLEFGTRHIAQRPFFRPAVKRIRPKFIKRLEAALSRATQ